MSHGHHSHHSHHQHDIHIKAIEVVGPGNHCMTGGLKFVVRKHHHKNNYYLCNGVPGPTGATGPTGSTGPIGATGPAGSINFAQFSQIGAQPTSIAASQPFTFTTQNTPSNSNITSMTGTFSAFPASGTVFELGNIGFYEVNYQIAAYPTDGGICIFQGTSLGAGGMLPVPYTMIGKMAAGYISVTGSVIIQTTTVGSFIAICAAAGNSAAIQPGPNSSTTNTGATVVSIKQIA